MPEVARTALLITGFVFVMMLVIEYLHVLTRGAWQVRLTRTRWGQYVLAAVLGALPGCLGAFAAVTMYSHGALSLGALVAAMVATSGDESFVMLAMIPGPALGLFGLLFALAIVAGFLTDAAVRRRAPAACDGFEVHEEEACECFPRGRLLEQWRECSAVRGVLAVGLAVFLLAIVSGQVGPAAWTWIRATLAAVSAVALFIVSTVPDHFLEEHLWRHVARRHVPRVFAWTLGTLAALHLLTGWLGYETALRQGKWLVLLAACLMGLIPESGPHLVFVTLYAQGTIPLSVLLASSIVQDGHGMLPLLAHSRRTFFEVKAANLLVGLAVGAAAMALGW